MSQYSGTVSPHYHLEGLTGTVSPHYHKEGLTCHNIQAQYLPITTRSV
jgi:hypothetical protein